MKTLKTLTNEQIDAFWSQGYLLLRGVFTPVEVHRMQSEVDRLLSHPDLVHADNWRTRFRKMPDGGQVLEKYDPVVDVSPTLRKVAEDQRIVGAVRDLFNDEVVLFKDKIIFKPAGAGGYGMHQDFTWWQPFPKEKLVSVLVAIDGADAANGALEVCPGRWTSLLTPEGELRGISEDEAKEWGLNDWVMVETEPGDICIFHCLVPHRSGTNASERSRRQFYPSYSAGKHGDLYRAHYRHYEEYIRRGLSEDERERLFFV